jgi:hypothetical protein
VIDCPHVTLARRAFDHFIRTSEPLSDALDPDFVLDMST